MNTKKSFKICYLLLVEGTTEFNLFAYLTKKKFRDDFAESSIQFSNKVEIVEVGVSQGNLNGVGNIKDFKKKYKLIREKYKGQKRFFMLDKDLDDSLKIKKLIKRNGDIVQFIEYNSEYLLLRFSGKNLKKPSGFTSLKNFRDYCKAKFREQFKKEASEFKESDFNLIFSNTENMEIHKSFNELFSTLSS